MRNSVVLPAPFGPTRPIFSPLSKRGRGLDEQDLMAVLLGDIVDADHGRRAGKNEAARLAHVAPMRKRLSAQASEQVEIFLLLPARDLCGVSVFLGAEARNLGVLDPDEIIHEVCRRRRSRKHALSRSAAKRFAEIFGIISASVSYGVSADGPGRSSSRDAIHPAGDLRREIEIRIGRRLADAVFQMCRRIALLADHPHHHAAIVLPPDHPVGRERIGAVALVAVHRRRGERRRGPRIGEQPGEPVLAERRQHLRGIVARRRRWPWSWRSISD